MAAPCAVSRRARLLPGLYGGGGAAPPSAPGAQGAAACGTAGEREEMEGASAWRVAERGSLRALERREILDLEAVKASAARSLEAIAKLRLSVIETGQSPLSLTYRICKNVSLHFLEERARPQAGRAVVSLARRKTLASLEAYSLYRARTARRGTAQ
jgi:hypothetical protein